MVSFFDSEKSHSLLDIDDIEQLLVIVKPYLKRAVF